LPCALRYGLFWRKFRELLRKMYIVLLQDRIPCRHLSVPLDLWCHSILIFFVDFFCLHNQCIRWRNIKVSHYHFVGVYLILSPLVYV
jgi:hypothetical protein